MTTQLQLINNIFIIIIINHQQTLSANCGTSVYASKEIRKSSVNIEQTKRSAETTKEHRTNRPTPQSKVLFVKLVDTPLLKNLPVFYWTTKLITALKTAGHLSLS